ncbi:MAG: BamA/TamA family outer membrane protein [Gemmatimonadales bacterium]
MRSTRGCGYPLALLIVVSCLGTAPALQAQYFGRNKVQYQSLKFDVLKTDHFDIYYYPDEHEAALAAARMGERWYDRLSTLFDHRLKGRQPLILYASSAQFRETNAIEGDLGEGTGGVTEALRRRILLPVGGTLGDLDHVIGHELTHAFQYDITGGGRGGLPTATQLPLWFIEGMAEYVSLGPVDPLTAMWMRGALADTTRDTLPTYRQLTDPRYFPYRYGHALLAYVGGRWGDPAIPQLLRAAGKARAMEPAIRQVLGMSPDTLVALWHRETHALYDSLQEGTFAPDATGPRLVAARRDAGSYNVSPSLSPDGTMMLFFSDRDLFSIDLFLADARTGKIVRQVTRTALDPHLQSLQFIQSAGSWSPDGRRFLFAGLSAGRPVLELYDVAGGKVEREVKFKDLGEILNPAWSPDGKEVAFSGNAGGLTDLYVFDFATGDLKRLTHDDFADLQPAWSPDGRELAFATDRFTSDLPTLAVGSYRIGILSLASGRIRRLPGPEAGRQLNPQWSPDGRSLYFLSNPDGVTNIFRADLASGSTTPLTKLYTGVSGVTETSPALSVAQRADRLVYSVFHANGYDVYAIEGPSAVGEKPVIAYLASVGGPTSTAAALPPVDRKSPILTGHAADSREGLPGDTSFAVSPYRAKLSLTDISRPSLFAGSGSFGTYVGGGASLYFSDMLGNHNLVTGLQVQGSLKDIFALVGYQNLSHRLNWGIVAQQAPYLTGDYNEGFADLNGETVFVQQQLLERQTNRDLNLQLSYPFSDVQRLDFSTGYTNVSFDEELQTAAFDAVTGAQVLQNTENLPTSPSLNLGVASMALVYDNSLFGATGPVLGQRYRLEVTPTVGSLSYVGVLADYRKYVMPVRPFTLAARLLHYGRYGQGGEDDRLQPLFLGDPGLVRGYTFGSFDASECNPPPNAPDSCPVFDRLLGSRIAVTSLELRFPLLGALGVGSGYYGAFPVDFLVFGDGGLAWDTQDEPSFAGGDRKPVFSAGAGLRVNLLGFAIGEVDLVRPFDRPGKGMVWQFNLQQGF